jgi:hypothetical protein
VTLIHFRLSHAKDSGRLGVNLSVPVIELLDCIFHPWSNFHFSRKVPAEGAKFIDLLGVTTSTPS